MLNYIILTHSLVPYNFILVQFNSGTNWFNISLILWAIWNIKPLLGMGF